MGALDGVKIVEMSGIGPAPFCAMLLADMGAEVIRVDRLAATDLGVPVDGKFDFLNRGKRAVAVDLKSADGIAVVKDLARSADMLIEGFRPGVMERLGLGPDVCLAVNPRLIFGRMTGWGQDGPLNQTAGHDINYIAIAGALGAIGERNGPPIPPLNLVGDFGGGSLYLAMGLLAALHETRTSGRGQVVDAAMVDGIASLMTMHFSFRQAGLWENARGSNMIDGGAPYYTTYRTLDGRFMAVGAIEQRFYRELIEGLGLGGEDLPGQNDRSRWGELRERIAAVFATRTREEWTAVFAGGDACVSPVLDMDECMVHPHAEARGVFETRGGVSAPAPAPRFSRTPSKVRGDAKDARSDTRDALLTWGFSEERIERLADARIIGRT